MNDRTHWQYCAVLNAETLTVEEVGAFVGAELGPQPKGLRYAGKIIMLIAEIKTRAIEESRVGIRALIEKKHPWVFERFPEARLEIMSEPERFAWLAEHESPKNEMGCAENRLRPFFSELGETITVYEETTRHSTYSTTTCIVGIVRDKTQVLVVARGDSWSAAIEKAEAYVIECDAVTEASSEEPPSPDPVPPPDQPETPPEES